MSSHSSATYEIFNLHIRVDLQVRSMLNISQFFGIFILLKELFKSNRKLV